MSGKQTKKLRQEVRRGLEAQGYTADNLGREARKALAVLKPWWVPRRLWDRITKPPEPPATPLDRLRQEVRDTAHAQVEGLLKGPAVLPDGKRGTVQDDIAVRALVGYGFSVSIEVRHPNEAGRAEEDPSTGPQIEIAR